MGMFAINILFNLGNVIPMNIVDTGNTLATCGKDVISPTTIIAGAGLFLGGKYGMVLYELFIVAASLMALKTGRTEASRWVEAASHALCVVVGIGVFVGWTVHWAPQFREAVADVKSASQSDVEQGFAIINSLLSATLVLFRVWVGLLGVVLVLWGWSRLVLRQLEREWNDALIDANAQWDRDRKPPAPSTPPPVHAPAGVTGLVGLRIWAHIFVTLPMHL